MRRFLRKWMIVAEPLDPNDDVCVQAAERWNGIYIRERLNRYFTLTAAEMDADQHADMWSRWLRFTVVSREDFWRGWR